MWWISFIDRDGSKQTDDVLQREREESRLHRYKCVCERVCWGCVLKAMCPSLPPSGSASLGSKIITCPAWCSGWSERWLQQTKEALAAGHMTQKQLIRRHIRDADTCFLKHLNCIIAQRIKLGNCGTNVQKATTNAAKQQATIASCVLLRGLEACQPPVFVT